MIIEEGKGLGKIRIGISTFADVIKVYGSNYNIINHMNYSSEIEFSNLGISFYCYYDDVEKKIFCITIKEPFQCYTSKEIVLGKSLIMDVIKAYGEQQMKVIHGG